MQLLHATSDAQSLSKNINTVKKHLSAIYNIGRRPGKTSLQASDIREVRMQSLLPRPQYKAFVVQEEKVIPPSIDSQLHATEDSHLPTASLLQDLYKSSQQDWVQLYRQLPIPNPEDS